MIKSLIFDFDGTLVDSEILIRKTFEKVTKKFAPHRLRFAREIVIGPPLKEAAKEILGNSNQIIYKNFINDFISNHDEHVLNFIRAYTGVHDTLKILNKNNVKMAIATNKRFYPTEKIIKYFGWDDYFCFVECSDSIKIDREKRVMVREIIEKDESFKNAYLIGDTLEDGISANINNLKFIKAGYGYGINQDWAKVQIDKNIKCLNDIVNYLKII